MRETLPKENSVENPHTVPCVRTKEMAPLPSRKKYTQNSSKRVVLVTVTNHHYHCCSWLYL